MFTVLQYYSTYCTVYIYDYLERETMYRYYGQDSWGRACSAVFTRGPKIENMPYFSNEKRYRKNSNEFELQEPRGTVSEQIVSCVGGLKKSFFGMPARFLKQLILTFCVYQFVCWNSV